MDDSFNVRPDDEVSAVEKLTSDTNETEKEADADEGVQAAEGHSDFVAGTDDTNAV